jgi:cysteine synthase A
VAELRASGRSGSVVTLLCDAGDRYAHTYYADEWLASQGLDLTGPRSTVDTFLATGEWSG